MIELGKLPKEVSLALAGSIGAAVLVGCGEDLDLTEPATVVGREHRTQEVVWTGIWVPVETDKHLLQLEQCPDVSDQCTTTTIEVGEEVFKTVEVGDSITPADYED